MISFKIENLPEKNRKIVDDWANGQANIQQSLANLVMHVVEYVGNADVMDFEVQRKLHMIFGNAAAPTVEKPLHSEVVPTETKNLDTTYREDVVSRADWFKE